MVGTWDKDISKPTRKYLPPIHPFSKRYYRMFFSKMMDGGDRGRERSRLLE